MTSRNRLRPRLHIGIVTVRDAGYHPNHRLLEAARTAGHTGFLIDPYRRWPMTHDCRTLVIGQHAEQRPDVVLPRQGAEISDTCLALLRQFQHQGIPLINHAAAVAAARNKFTTLQMLTAAGLPCPDTVLINDASGLARAIDQLGGYPVVVKPVSGRQGLGVLRITDPDDAHRRALPSLDRRRGMMVQRYLPPEDRQDIRALVVGGRLVCAAQLTPSADDFRANFHLGSDIRATDLSGTLEETAVRAAATIGLEVAGVDLLIDKNKRPLIIEVNYAPGFRGLETATGLDIASRIINHAVTRVGDGPANMDLASE